MRINVASITDYVDNQLRDAETITYTAPLTGAVETNVEARLSERVSVKDFGAVGDGTTDDTAAFAALEAASPGIYVDLQENVYVVTALPTGAKYYNGDFVVGSTRTSLRRNRLDHPLDGNQWIAFGNGKTHYWLLDLVYLEGSGTLLAFVKPSWRHSQSYSSPLNVVFSEDKGQTWSGEKTILTVDDFDVADVGAGVMGSGRIGVLAGLRDASNNYRNDFVYSDDNGDTWTVSASEIASPNGTLPYGTMLPYPASAGGNDTTGFMVYGYEANDCHYAATTDNGATWSVTEIFVDQGYAEPSVVQVPGQDKWIAFVRVNGGNLRIATSTNMTTWGAATDTGIALENNPVYAVVDGGQVYVYLAIRDIDPTLSVQNDIICIEDGVSAVYDASNFTNAAQRQVITGTERCLGYFSIVDVGQDFIWGYTAGEYDGSTNSAAESYVAMGGTRRVPAVGLGLVRQLANQPNIVRNPTFEFWSRGTSFPSFTSTTSVADGWKVNPSGSTITAQRSELSVEDSRLLPFSGRYSLDISATSDNYIGFYQDYPGESQLYRFADNNITVQVWGFGDVPDLLYGSVLFDYGTGGSADAYAIVNFKQTEGADLLWKATATIPTQTLEGKTIGTDPFVRLGISASGTGTWDLKVAGVKAEFGTIASAFTPVDVDHERLRSAEYVQKLEFGSADQICNGFSPGSSLVFWGVMNFPKMRTIPSASLNVGAASDIEIYNASAFGTGLTLTEVSEDRLSFRVNTTGLTAGNAYIARVKSGSSIEILLDTE